MNGSRRHAARDRGFGRSATDAATRGALLVAVAVVVGLLLLWRAHDGGDSATAVGVTTTARPAGVTTTTAATDQTTTTARPATGATGQVSGATGATTGLHTPAQVKVLVANGTGTSNGAGNVTQKLIPKGYSTLSAANASSSSVAQSKIYYREGYAEDAKQIARDLQVPAPVESIIEAMPANPPVATNAVERANSANVLVVIGTDGKIKQ